MIIWRGLGILAPIIYAAIYMLLYGFFKLLATPQFTHGWFVYLGAIVAGWITFKAGRAINAEMYAARKIHPNQSINSHSFFFIPFEFWGILFAIITIGFGYKNNTEVKQKKVQQVVAENKSKIHFEQKVYLLDSLIQHPKKDDYFLTGFTGKYKYRGIEKTKHFSLPLKVTDFNETQIELFCLLDDPMNNELKYSNKMELLYLFSRNTENGFKTWVNKSTLMEAVNRRPNTSDVNKTSIPSLVPTDPISINDIWRIDGPEFKQHTWDWNNQPSGIKLELKNIGLPATMQKVVLNGQEISWKKVQHVGRGNVKHKGVDYSNDDVVRMEQYFYIIGNGSNPGPDPLVEIFCTNHQGHSFRFDIKKGERSLQIKRHRL